MSEEEHTQREPSPTDMGLTFEATLTVVHMSADGFVRWTADYKHIPRPGEKKKSFSESSNTGSHGRV